MQDGIVSVEKDRLTANALPLDAPISDYPQGVSARRVLVNADDPINIELYRVLNSLLDTNFTNQNWLRFYITTTRDSVTAFQQVEVILRHNSNYDKIFELRRNFEDGVWKDWHLQQIERHVKQQPEGNISGYYGMIVRGNNSGKLYVKIGSKTSVTTEGWELVYENVTTAVGTRSSDFNGTFAVNLTKQGIFTKIDIRFVNPNGTTAQANNEIFIGTVPEGFRPTGQPHRMYVGDNSSAASGSRSPKHAIIIGTDGRILWTPSANTGYLTMNGVSVY